MSTQAQDRDLALIQQVVDFKPPKFKFTLHNSKSKDVDVSYVGHLMTVPHKDRISERAPARDADGDPIPGTLQIEDIYTYSHAVGDEVVTFNAVKAVQHILGIQKVGGGLTQASSRFAVGGVSLMPPNPSKETIAAIRKEGERRAFLVEVDNARNTVSAQDAGNATRKRRGDEPIPGGPDYERARWVLQEYEKLHRSEVGSYVAGAIGVAPDLRTSDETEIDDEIEFDVYARALLRPVVNKAADAAEAKGQAVDRVALLDELLADPEVRLKAQKKWKIRRIGRMAPTAEALKVAQAAGTQTQDTDEDPTKEE